MHAIFNYFGKVPCKSERFTMWTRRGLNIVLSSLITDEGKLSHPLVQVFRFSMTLLISGSLVGLIKIFDGQWFLM
jgi:hypothetical protein